MALIGHTHLFYLFLLFLLWHSKAKLIYYFVCVNEEIIKKKENKNKL